MNKWKYVWDADGSGDAAAFNNPAGIVINNGSLLVADYSTIREVAR